jgi:hypothetical protein
LHLSMRMIYSPEFTFLLLFLSLFSC